MAATGGTVEHRIDWGLLLGSTAIALAGLGAAWYMYVHKPAAADKVARSASTLYYLSLNKLYVDEIYNLVFVQPLNLLAGICGLLEAIVNDLVRLIASMPRALANVLRPLQNGLVQFYALAMVLGVVVFIGYLVLSLK